MNGVTPESSGWAAGATPEKIWTAKVGPGSSSPVIAAGKVYTMGWQNGTDAVFCYDAKTGKELWKQSYASKYQSRDKKADEQNYGGPSSTPTFDAATGFLYTMGIDGDLKCWDTAKAGAPVWGKNLFTDLKVNKRPDHDYGFTNCPLVLGDVVLCEATAPGGTVTAFDKKTGAPKWASAYNGPAGHTGGAALMQVSGSPCLAYLTLKNLVVIGAGKGTEGKTIAQTGWSTEYDANIPTPAASGNLVFVTSSYNHGGAMVCYELGAAGLKQKWEAKGVASKVGSPVPYKDSVFLVDDSCKCVDMATGKLKWKGGGFGLGNCLVTAGDNKVIAFGNNKIVLLDAAATEYKELAKVDAGLSDTCYPQIAISDGIMVAKDKGGSVSAFKVGK
jgi:outer membrane protein assembly factor BamB